MIKLWKSFTKLLAQNNNSRPVRRRLEVETLEDRITPATAVFQNGLADPFTGETYAGTEDVMIRPMGFTETYGASLDLQVGSKGSINNQFYTLLRFPSLPW